jgi:membrane associated rhomboid family serine protease
MIPLKDNIPAEHPPLVTVALIIANVVVYVLAVRHGGSLLHGPDARETVRLSATPFALTHPGYRCGLRSQEIVCARGRLPGALPPWETVFTGMFLHGSILHIGGNMLFLWIFGNNVEDAMGHARYLAFYLLGGLAALALQVAVSPDSAAPTLGASGAIAAVLGGYILMYPRAKVLTVVFIILFFTVLELPAVLMLGAWFAEQVAFAATDVSDPAGGGVAYFAHVGGFIFGLLAIRLFARHVKRATPPRVIR